MKSAIIHKLIERPFNDVYEIILKNIIAHGFLVLHEINTQSIVGKHGIRRKKWCRQRKLPQPRNKFERLQSRSRHW